MNKYFGNSVSIISTMMVYLAIAYIVYTVLKQRNIKKWGRRTALLASFGLLLCCFVAARDGYDKSVQSAIDGVSAVGIFTINSIQSTLCCLGGAMITFASFSSIFVKNQKYRKIMFFLVSGSMIFKILVIEISRWLV